MNAKQKLRNDLDLLRKQLDPAWVTEASERIINQITEQPAFKQAQTIALYMALPSEVNLQPLLQLCWDQSKHTCIPLFNTTTKLYELAEITHNTEFRVGNYGIMEPQNSVLIDSGSIDLMIVPAVAFDRSGNRLGRGGGYYDRLLIACQGSIIGVAFDFQLLPAIPIEPHDIPVQTIITDRQLINGMNEY